MSTFERVALWNTICGKNAPEFGTVEYYDALENQNARIAEEMEEMNEAIQNCKILLAAEEFADVTLTYKGQPVHAVCCAETIAYWNQEILDAGCDLDVVVAGANFLSGHHYEDAIDAVLSNNDLKYTYDRRQAEAALLKLGTRTHRIVTVPINVEDEHSDDDIKALGYDIVYDADVRHVNVYTVHRNSDDKICKLLDHPTVNLRPFMAN